MTLPMNAVLQRQLDTLPPGLYEAVFEPKTDTTTGADLVTGEPGQVCDFCARPRPSRRAMNGFALEQIWY
jgi:hypothetical protein